MYQKAVNKILQKDFFKVDYYQRCIKRFVISIPTIQNKLDEYIQRKRKLPGLEQKIQAICYNSSVHPSSWEIDPKSIWYFDKHGPVIPVKLCEKIIRNIKKDFMNGIRDGLLDYHILFHDDGSQFQFNEYPPIYVAMGYIDTYPIVYFEEDFTADEMKVLTKYLKGQVFIVVLKRENKIKLYRDINKGKYVSMEIPLTPEGIIQTTLFMTCHKINVLQKMVEKLTPKDYEKLWSILDD